MDKRKTARADPFQGEKGPTMIVALLNQKGGVGKTTLATHIAGELALRGQHVVLLDADKHEPGRQSRALSATG